MNQIQKTTIASRYRELTQSFKNMTFKELLFILGCGILGAVAGYVISIVFMPIFEALDNAFPSSQSRP